MNSRKFGGEHLVDGKAGAYLAQEVDIVEIEQPIGVVDDDGAVFALEVHKAGHLLFEALDIVLYRLAGEHAAKVGAPRRIADHRGAAANKYDGTVSRLLQTARDYHLHEMPDMQTVRGGIETDIERLRTAVQELFELIFEDGLADYAALFELVDDISHNSPDAPPRRRRARNSLFTL